MKALMLLTEKRDGTIKGCCVYDGSKKREWSSGLMLVESPWTNGKVSIHPRGNTTPRIEKVCVGFQSVVRVIGFRS